jgi:hypothetical protein
MGTTTQELIYQILTLIVSGSLAIISAEVKSYLKKKKEILGYEFDNDRVERILDNAVHFAEAKAKARIKVKAEELSDNEKLIFAKAYINKIDKNVVAKYGSQLDSMIERKVAQRFN